MKITCEVIRDLLPLYVDQMLSSDSLKLVEEHLEVCESCRKFLEELQKESNYPDMLHKDKEIEEDARAAFRGIRRTLLKKTILAV